MRFRAARRSATITPRTLASLRCVDRKRESRSHCSRRRFKRSNFPRDFPNLRQPRPEDKLLLAIVKDTREKPLRSDTHRITDSRRQFLTTNQTLDRPMEYSIPWRFFVPRTYFRRSKATNECNEKSNVHFHRMI